jgi:phosphatidate cytidylyltransferase
VSWTDPSLPGSLLHPPWDEPAFWTCATILAALAVASAVALALVTSRGRGGAPPRTLWARWLTWLVLASLFTLACFAGLVPVAVLLGMFALQGTREWATLLDLPVAHRRLLAVDSALALALSIFGAVALLATVPILLLLGMLQPVLGADTRRGMRDLAFGALGFAYLPLLLAFGVLLVRDRPDGASLLFLVAAMAAFSDIGAYVVGKSLGRRPLAPALSPNKTQEGVVGNLVGAALAALLFSSIVPLDALGLIVLVVIVALAAVWGDLFKSALKREVGVKDAGTLLPGFGGLLDRVDSLIVALPLVYYALGAGDLIAANGPAT